MGSLNDFLTELVRDTMPMRCIKVPELKFYTVSNIVEYLEMKLDKSGINEALWTESQAEANKADIPGLEKRIGAVFRDACKYSIFSHTWLHPEQGGEINFDNAVCVPGSLEASLNGFSKTKSLSLYKLQGFIQFSIEAKVSFIWADTVCINKDTSIAPPEVSICIPNMFQYYSRSAICIVYLANSNTVEDIWKDPWFTRGWTLQELLAPRNMMFYGSNWQCLGGYSKDQWTNMPLGLNKGVDISSEVTLASGIRHKDLLSFHEGRGRASIPARMYWMLNRKTTLPQDQFYALIGIFRIYRGLDIRYDYGSERTFFNLLRAILENEQYPNDLSIFNYSGRSVNSNIATTSILPSRLKCYKYASPSLKEINDMRHKPRFDLTPDGLAVNVVLVFGLPVECPKDDKIDGRFKFTFVQNIHSSGRIWSKKPFTFKLLNETEEDKKKVLRFKRSNCVVFAIWTFEDSGDYVCFPHTCSAFLLGVTLPEALCEVGVSTIDFPEELINRAAKFDTVRPIIFKRRRCVPKVNVSTAAVGSTPANQAGDPMVNISTGTALEDEEQGPQYSAPVSSQDLERRQIRDVRLRIKKDHLYFHNMIYLSTYL